jgi:glycosyltransferase involved in cell wall biosynthesis
MSAPSHVEPVAGIPGLVSVVMPAYEAEEFIGEALDSVFAQDHPSVEVIVVDDGSTDRTAEIAAERGARVLKRANGGPAAARNTGIAAARGEFLAVIDADDLWPADRLSCQVAYLRAHPEVGIVLALTEIFLTPGQPPPPHHRSIDPQERVPGHPSTMLARRELFDSIGPYDESLIMSEDLDWLSRATDSGVRLGRIERTMLRYRIHAHNTTRDVERIKLDTMRVMRASVRRKRGVGA